MPTDFSGFSGRALEYAARLAGAYDSDLEVLHVAPPLALQAGVGYGPAPLPPDPAASARQLAQLEEFARPARSGGRGAATRLENGAPVGVIVERAARVADLVVMGTHGIGGFEGWVLGSVTEKVLRKAPCPVLTVPPAAAGQPPPSEQLFQRILCPLERPAPTPAFELALELAVDHEAELLLLHVIERAPEGERWTAHRAELLAEARTELRRSVGGMARERCRIEDRLCVGTAWKEVLRVAAEERSELIVMGAHTAGALGRAFFGSTVGHVVRGASCPVLTLRAPDTAPGAEAAGRGGGR